jgi:hypothetical protein
MRTQGERKRRLIAIARDAKETGTSDFKILDALMIRLVRRNNNMGCFGYICKGCGTHIAGDCFIGGEKCVLIHVRHGEEIGRVEGHYNEYGRVIEQEFLPEDERYRGDIKGPNGHDAICASEFEMEDSYYRLRGLRVYRGREISYMRFVVIKKHELRETLDPSLVEDTWDAMESGGAFEREFAALPVPIRERYSGTVAWHSRCYNRATPEERADMTPSETDPNQSWGRIRKKYK